MQRTRLTRAALAALAALSAQPVGEASPHSPLGLFRRLMPESSHSGFLSTPCPETSLPKASPP